MHPYPIPVWKQAPLLRVVVSMIIGILFQFYVDFSFLFITLFLSASVFFFFLFYKLPLHYQYDLRKWHSKLIICMIISFGMLLTWHQDIRNSESFFLKHYHKGDALILKIESPLIQKENTFTTTASVVFVVKSNTNIAVNGILSLIFRKSDTARSLKYGDLIFVDKSVNEIKNAGNPGSFDNKRYAFFQQIYHQLYLKGNEFKTCGRNQASEIHKLAYALRDNTIGELQKNIQNDNANLGIAEALLIGYRYDLDREIVQAYSNAGVVHIIAISGMHLGLIYFSLIWLLNKIPYLKNNSVIKAFILLIFLWLFSLMTGASASVLRSAVMFTCIIFGIILNRKSPVYNSLAASAFLLLCYNPYFLWDVGFQLSYCAIIGIVWLQQPICKLYQPKNYILRKIWEMSSVTLASQIITFPLCLYYFHQFPVYFLLSNLVAVPLSTVILFEEIAMICFSGLLGLSSWIGRIVDCSLLIMNKLILFFDKIPGSVINNIHADLQTTVILYLFLLFFVIFLLRRNRDLFKWSLLLLTFFISFQSMARLKWLQQKFMVVFRIPKSSAMKIINGKKSYRRIDDEVIQNERVQNFVFKPAQKYFMATDDDSVTLPENAIISFGGKKILCIDSTFDIKKTATGILVDYLIISGNPDVDFYSIVSHFNCQKIIFDSSNSLWKTTKWKKDCEMLHLHCFSVNEDGAFIASLE